jgi:hypothetical protein
MRCEWCREPGRVPKQIEICRDCGPRFYAMEDLAERALMWWRTTDRVVSTADDLYPILAACAALARVSPCRHGLTTDCAECHGGSSPEMESGNAPPAPQRFWRVDSPEGVDCMLRAYVCDERGVPIHGLSQEWRTREQAEADGRASGLPEWPGGKR